MSMSVQTLVRQSTIRDATQVHVLEYLANCGDDSGGNCFPGTPLIARTVRRSERTVVRTIAELEAQGWIGIVKLGNGSGNLTEFQINIEKLKECQDVTLLPRSKRVTLAKRKGVTVTIKGDTSDNPPHPLYRRTVIKRKSKQTPPDPLVNEGEERAEETSDAGKTKSRSASVAGNCVSNREGVRPDAAPDARAATAAHLQAGSGVDQRPPDRGDGDRAIERAVDQVMNGLSLTKRRDRRRIRAVIEMEMDKGEPAATAALSMMDAFRRQEQARLRGELTASYGVMNFFERGVWKKEGRWHWNEEVLRQRGQASVGSAR